MNYEVSVRRKDRWWMIEIPSIGGLTQARRLGDVETEATDFIVADQDVAPSSVEVEVTSIVIDDRDYSYEIHEVSSSRAAAVQAELDAMEKTRRLARELAQARVPIRDIGRALGVSYQRAHQLVSS